MRLRNQVEPVIATVLARNRQVDPDLEGGAFCASFDRPPNGEPWVQVETTLLNVFYPSEQEPLAVLRSRVPSLPKDAVCVGWEPGNYATFQVQAFDAATAAMVVEELFLHFYNLSAVTPVRSEIVDLRSARDGGG